MYEKALKHQGCARDRNWIAHVCLSTGWLIFYSFIAVVRVLLLLLSPVDQNV